MSKITRSKGRRSIKGLIPPVANTRRHRELISPNRGNKRGASWWKIERPRREMDLLELDERWTSASPRRSNGSSVLAKGGRPPFVRLVCSRSATNEKLVQELWKGSELTRGRLWICRNGPKGRFPDFGFSRCVRTISLKRIVSPPPPPPPPPSAPCHPVVTFPQIGHGNGIEFIKFKSIGTLDLETEGVNRWMWKYAQIFRVNIEP